MKELHVLHGNTGCCLTEEASTPTLTDPGGCGANVSLQRPEKTGLRRNSTLTAPLKLKLTIFQAKALMGAAVWRPDSVWVGFF